MNKIITITLTIEQAMTLRDAIGSLKAEVDSQEPLTERHAQSLESISNDCTAIYTMVCSALDEEEQ